jgi:hypothetical protein
MRAPAWLFALGLGFAGLACIAPARGVGRPANAPRSVQVSVADSIFTGVRLPAPMVEQLADNDIFDALGVVRPGADTTLSFALPATRAMTAVLLSERVRWSFRAPDGSEIIPGKTPNTDDYASAEPGDLPGFWLRHPASGVWHVKVEAMSRDSAATYMIFVSADENLPRNAHLETMVRSALPRISNIARPGDVVFVRTFLTDELVPALVKTGDLRELRTQVFMPWIERLWDTPDVAHDNPTDQRFHASLILGFVDTDALRAFFDSGEIAMLSGKLPKFASAVHAYEVTESLTYVKDGKVLANYQV